MTEERLAGILAKLNTMLSEWRESRHRPHDTIDEWLRMRRWWVKEKQAWFQLRTKRRAQQQELTSVDMTRLHSQGLQRWSPLRVC